MGRGGTLVKVSGTKMEQAVAPSRRGRGILRGSLESLRMPFALVAHHRADHLVVEASGQGGLAELCACMDFTGSLARASGYRKAVLDLRALEVTLSFTEHLQLGAHAADRLQGLQRVASVVPAKYRTGTSEKAARKSGLPLKTFTSLQEGIAWLAEPELEPS